jgi:murein DD-endopeptidase MepM/ murein hydrolase activator NlpD
LGQVFFLTFSLLILSALLFVCILYMQSTFFTTPASKALRDENQALQKHYVKLTTELTEIKAAVTTLNQLDESVHQKLFEEPRQREPNRMADQQTLITNVEVFNSLVNLLNSKSGKLFEHASQRNFQHASAPKLTAGDMALLMSLPTRQPIENNGLTKLVSGFGTRINPYHKGNYHHPGVDFAVPKGTSIFATASGTIVDISRSNLEVGYGNYIDIDHGNGVTTRYAHLDQIQVRMHQKVSKGTVIGTAGMSGGAVAPHLHYEIIRNNEQVNPVNYMMEGLTSTQYHQLRLLGIKQNQSLD